MSYSAFCFHDLLKIPPLYLYWCLASSLSEAHNELCVHNGSRPDTDKLGDIPRFCSGAGILQAGSHARPTGGEPGGGPGEPGGGRGGDQVPGLPRRLHPLHAQQQDEGVSLKAIEQLCSAAPPAAGSR